MEPKIILLVDDNPDDQELTRIAFAKCAIPHELVVVRDGAEALDYLFGVDERGGRRLRMPPSLILLDLNMPKVNGHEVMERIRSDEQTKLLPVIILTSSREVRDIAQGYQLGVNSYIRKPVDFDQFTEVVRQIGLYWLALNEPPPVPGLEK